MAVKTITIDMEAYELLSRRKKTGQSFSQVIKEQFGARKTVKQFREVSHQITISEDTLDNVQILINRRKRHPARPVRL